MNGSGLGLGLGRGEGTGRGMRGLGHGAYATLMSRERRVLAACPTPRATQRWVDAVAYNHEERGETLRGFRGVVRSGTAHCAEAALAAAVPLERLGHRPRLLDLRSPDRMDHFCALWRDRDGRWGAVAQSKYPGLRGRRAVFATIPALVRSYVDPFVDGTGEVEAWAVYDLSRHPRPWRLASGNVWHVQHAVNRLPHARVRTSRAHVEALRTRYVRWKRARGVDPGDHALEPPVAFYPGLRRVVL